MQRTCKICEQPYEMRFYGQHRRTRTHLVMVSHRTVQYGGRTSLCQACQTEYPVGSYSLHVAEDVHMEATAKGSHELARETGTEILERRDEWIAGRIGVGATYGEIATELGISRQRVHQICQSLGISSKGHHRSKFVGLPRICFYDGMAYIDWKKHLHVPKHQEAIEEFKSKVGRVRRSDS